MRFDLGPDEFGSQKLSTEGLDQLLVGLDNRDRLDTTNLTPKESQTVDKVLDIFLAESDKKGPNSEQIRESLRENAASILAFYKNYTTDNHVARRGYEYSNILAKKQFFDILRQLESGQAGRVLKAFFRLGVLSEQDIESMSDKRE